MFDIAWEDFTRLSKSGQPFLQSMITLSTHAHDGIIPKACENIEYNFQGNSVRMLRAVKCTDMLVGNFIKKNTLQRICKKYAYRDSKRSRGALYTKLERNL